MAGEGPRPPEGQPCHPDPVDILPVMAVVMVGTILAPLDGSIFDVALPRIADTRGDTRGTFGLRFGYRGVGTHRRVVCRQRDGRRRARIRRRPHGRVGSSDPE